MKKELKIYINELNQEVVKVFHKKLNEVFKPSKSKEFKEFYQIGFETSLKILLSELKFFDKNSFNITQLIEIISNIENIIKD
jgi:hypothetical protein